MNKPVADLDFEAIASRIPGPADVALI